MIDPRTEAPDSDEPPETRRIAFEIAIDLWNELQREAAESSITEGKNVSISEVARRRIVANAKAVA